MRCIFKRKFLQCGGSCLLLLAGNSISAQENSPPESKADDGSKSARAPQDPDQESGHAHEITAVAESPDVFPPEFEGYCGAVFWKWNMAWRLPTAIRISNGLIKWGVFKNLELRFGNNPFVRDGGVGGFGDSGAGFKYRIISQEGALPTFSILYTASFPTSTGAPGIGAMGHGVDVLLSKDFGKHHFDFQRKRTAFWQARGPMATTVLILRRSIMHIPYHASGVGD